MRPFDDPERVRVGLGSETLAVDDATPFWRRLIGRRQHGSPSPTRSPVADDSTELGGTHWTHLVDERPIIVVYRDGRPTEEQHPELRAYAATNDREAIRRWLDDHHVVQVAPGESLPEPWESLACRVAVRYPSLLVRDQAAPSSSGFTPSSGRKDA